VALSVYGKAKSAMISDELQLKSARLRDKICPALEKYPDLRDVT
jgi:hypothetical protein